MTCFWPLTLKRVEPRAAMGGRGGALKNDIRCGEVGCVDVTAVAVEVMAAAAAAAAAAATVAAAATKQQQQRSSSSSSSSSSKHQQAAALPTSPPSSRTAKRGRKM